MRQKLVPRTCSASHNEEKHREPPADRFYSLESKQLRVAPHRRDAPGHPPLCSQPQYTFRSSVRSRSATGTSMILYPKYIFSKVKRYITFNRKVYKFQIKGIYLFNGRYIPMGSRFARYVYRACERTGNDTFSSQWRDYHRRIMRIAHKGHPYRLIHRATGRCQDGFLPETIGNLYNLTKSPISKKREIAKRPNTHCYSLIDTYDEDLTERKANISV